MRTSADCDRQRRVICQQSPLSYLDVETELLLITDGRSNDPRDFGISIEEMKDLYSKTEINVSIAPLRNILRNKLSLRYILWHTILGFGNWCRSYQRTGNPWTDWQSRTICRRRTHFLFDVLGICSKIQQNFRKSFKQIRSNGLPSTLSNGS